LWLEYPSCSLDEPAWRVILPQLFEKKNLEKKMSERYAENK
jgi:hypothetical protein